MRVRVNEHNNENSSNIIKRFNDMIKKAHYLGRIIPISTNQTVIVNKIW